MKPFETSLLREKFVIHDHARAPGDPRRTLVVLSNRMAATFPATGDAPSESFVVRAQNMHGCVRMLAALFNKFEQDGSLVDRKRPHKWGELWDKIISDYEYTYNPQRWVAVYHKGACVFVKGERHALLDIIEKCDADGLKTYEDAITAAETLFLKTGKDLKITYDPNMALRVHTQGGALRIGAVQRTPTQKSTFSFSITPKAARELNVAPCLNLAAAFLEGIQLSFIVGMNTEKIRIGQIEHYSKEENQTREARQRIARLSLEISAFEKTATVRYRPEKPDFSDLVEEAEKFAQGLF